MLNLCSEVKTVAKRLQDKIISGMDPAEAWNELSVDLLQCAKVIILLDLRGNAMKWACWAACDLDKLHNYCWVICYHFTMYSVLLYL